MKSKWRTVFLKQECVTRSVFICSGLVALIGCNCNLMVMAIKGAYLGSSAIIASYSFIVDIVFCLSSSVQSWLRIPEIEQLI